MAAENPMLQILLRWICCIGIILLGACVPVGGVYYTPIASGGSVYRQDCHSGALSNIRFDRSGVKILVLSRYRPTETTELALIIQFELSKLDQVNVDWRTMRAFSGDTSIIPIENAAIYAANMPLTSDNLQKIQNIDGVEEMRGANFGFYEIHINVNLLLPNKFKFVLPSMTINGTEYPGTEIEFTRKSGLWFIPVNC